MDRIPEWIASLRDLVIGWHSGDLLMRIERHNYYKKDWLLFYCLVVSTVPREMECCDLNDSKFPGVWSVSCKINVEFSANIHLRIEAKVDDYWAANKLLKLFSWSIFQNFPDTECRSFGSNRAKSVIVKASLQIFGDCIVSRPPATIAAWAASYHFSPFPVRNLCWTW